MEFSSLGHKGEQREKRDEKKTYDHQERKVMGNPNPNA